MRSRYLRFSCLFVGLASGSAAMAVAQDSGSSSVADVTVTSTVGTSAPDSSVVSASSAGGQSGGGGRLSTGMQFAGTGAFGVPSHGWGLSSPAAGASSMVRAESLPSVNTSGTRSRRSSLSAQSPSAPSAMSPKSSAGSTKTPVGARSDGSGTYSAGFPDSTKGTAVISPPDGLSSALFNFAPFQPEEATDLNNREFLAPSLQVAGGSGSSSQGGQEDIYKKLRKYLDASHNGSMKSKSGKHTPAMTNSLKKSSTLKSAKSSGLIF